MTNDDTDNLAFLEATLFTTDKSLTKKQLQNILKMDENHIDELINQLKEKYNRGQHGIILSEIGGYKLTVKPDFEKRVSHLTPHADLSRGLLRVLAIITYYEPVKQSDIVKVIGNRTYEYVKDLVERGFVKSEKIGRTKILKITPTFEQYFGIKKHELKENLKISQKKGVDQNEGDNIT